MTSESPAIREFEMDGDMHEVPTALTGCCAYSGKACRHCGGWMHMQPGYGTIDYLCEECGSNNP